MGFSLEELLTHTQRIYRMVKLGLIVGEDDATEKLAATIESGVGNLPATSSVEDTLHIEEVE
jgi:hypothetical protein